MLQAILYSCTFAQQPKSYTIHLLWGIEWTNTHIQLLRLFYTKN